MKPSILIFSQAMELGGVERSLLGLLDSIDYDRYDVDLFLMRHSGELMPYLNPKARLLPLGIVCCLPLLRREPKSAKGILLADLASGLLLIVCIVFILSSSYNPFIYFRF